MVNLNELEIYTGAEASELLGKEKSYIRQLFAKYPNRFPEGSIRKFGKEYIVTQEAINALRQQNAKRAAQD